uniref:Apyrase n=1 Tax=Panagrolaimus sp. ES5 TaxID=591445 RepID=A0AC34FJ97_9BILA
MMVIWSWKYISLIFCITFFVAFVASFVEEISSSSSDEISADLSPELIVEEAHEPRFFAAVIDAGSTGTRLHLFEFRHSLITDSAPFELVQEVFKEVKPGLSSFSSEPKEAAKSVKELLLHAKSVIPTRLLSHTPIVVQATAGLRLLPGNEAEDIIREVKSVVKSSGFLLGDEAVGILSGIDEGIFAWFTLNFLSGRLNFGDDINVNDRTAAALDLGGGSTQITFNQMNQKDSERTHQVGIFDKDFELYTHSYLGNGLIAARLGIASLLENTKEPELLETHCLPPGIKIKDWQYAGKVFQVNPSEEASFEKCLQQAADFVKNVSKISPVEDLADIPVFAFSYFFDRGMQAGMIKTEPKNRGGWIEVKQYKEAAKKACKITPETLGIEHWRPWLCMDLTYIYALLSKGYGLSDKKSIHLTKKMKDMEVSWALGAGFHLLNTYHHEHFATSPRNSTLSSRIFHQVVSFISSKATNVLGFFNLIS